MATTTLNTKILLRNDEIADWQSSDLVQERGEPGVAFDENGNAVMKIGDGEHTWEQLPSNGVSNHYEGTRQEGENDNAVFTRVLGSTVPQAGDIFVIKTVISGDKTSYTAFVYDEGAWQAMDGNYNAENVYFGSDMTFTTAVGTITIPSSGSATVAATGKNVKQLLESIFAEEKNPTTTQPSVSLTFNQRGSYEVGTSITPTYSATLNPGSYQYGPATGVTATSWSVTDTNSGSASTASGSFTAFTVADDTNYKITATATYGDGAIPTTNLGNEYATGQIKGGSKSATSAAVSGYRKPFWGYKTTAELDMDALTSAQIRGLGQSGNSQGALPTSYTVVNPMQIVFAAKKGVKNSLTVANASAGNAPVDFTKITDVMVEGINGHTAAAYDVWYAEFAAPLAGTNNLTLTWA